MKIEVVDAEKKLYRVSSETYGESVWYDVDMSKMWTCSCPARGLCKHIRLAYEHQKTGKDSSPAVPKKVSRLEI